MLLVRVKAAVLPLDTASQAWSEDTRPVIAQKKACFLAQRRHFFRLRGYPLSDRFLIKKMADSTLLKTASSRIRARPQSAEI